MSTNGTDPYEARTLTTDIIVGVLYMALSLLCGIAYSVILIVIRRDKDLMKLPSYKFMFVLGMLDVTQCFPHFITGLMTIFQTTWITWLPQALGIVVTPCYVGYTIMTLILALNRFLQFSSSSIARSLYKPEALKYWYVFAAAIWILFMVALGSPWAAIEYIPSRYSWSYNYSLPYSELVQRSEMVIELGTIIISAFFYILTIACHKQNLRKLNPQDRRVETKILQQVIVITLYCTVLNFFWHNSYFLPASLWTDTALNLMWILNSGVYPIIYIIVNRAIKESFRGERSNVSRTIVATF